MAFGIGYYPASDQFVSLRAANLQESVVWTTAQQDTFGGQVVTPGGGLSNPDDGVFGGICVHKFVKAGGALPFVSAGVIEVDDWAAAVGSELLPDGNLFLGFDGTLLSAPPIAAHIIQVGTTVDPHTLNANFPLKVTL